MVLSSRSWPHVRAHAARCTPESRGHEAARHDVLAGRHSPAGCQTSLRSQDTPSGAFLMPAPHGTESSRISCHHGDAASERTRGRDFVLEAIRPVQDRSRGHKAGGPAPCPSPSRLNATYKRLNQVPCARTIVELAESLILRTISEQSAQWFWFGYKPQISRT